MDKILVVSESDIVTLAKSILEGAGYKVVTATDGDEAIIKVGAEMPDLILLDVVMPGKSGLLVCEVLKSQAKTMYTPVVMFTVPGREADKKLCMEAGADGHFTKPFTREDLLSEVKNQLEKIRAWRFSKPLGVEHRRLKGEKLLLEFESDLPYERCVRDFALEGRANGEKVVILTPKSSVISQAFERDEDIELVPLTDEAMISPILDAHAGKPLALIYDNISDRILTSGFKNTYNFLRNTLELLSKSEITALFLINPKFHPENETTIIRALFSQQVTYGKDGLTKTR